MGRQHGEWEHKIMSKRTSDQSSVDGTPTRPRTAELCPRCKPTRLELGTVEWTDIENCTECELRERCTACNVEFWASPCDLHAAEYACLRCEEYGTLGIHRMDGMCDNCVDVEAYGRCAICEGVADMDDMLEVTQHGPGIEDDATCTVCSGCYECTAPGCETYTVSGCPQCYTAVVDADGGVGPDVYHKDCVKACRGPCGRVVVVGPLKFYGPNDQWRYNKARASHPQLSLKIHSYDENEEAIYVCADCETK